MASGIPPLVSASPPPMNRIDAVDELDSDGSDDFSEEDFRHFAVGVPVNPLVDTPPATSSTLKQNEQSSDSEYSTCNDILTVLPNVTPVVLNEQPANELSAYCPANEMLIRDAGDISVDSVADSSCERIEPQNSSNDSISPASNENVVFVIEKQDNGTTAPIIKKKGDNDNDWCLRSADQFSNDDSTCAFQFGNFDLHDDHQVDVVQNHRSVTDEDNSDDSFSVTTHPTAKNDSDDFKCSEGALQQSDEEDENSYILEQNSTGFDERGGTSDNLPDMTSDYGPYYDVAPFNSVFDDNGVTIKSEDRHPNEMDSVILTSHDTSVDPVSSVKNKEDLDAFESVGYDYDDDDDDDFSDFVSPISFVNNDCDASPKERYVDDSRCDLQTQCCENSIEFASQQHASGQNESGVPSIRSSMEISSTINLSEKDCWSDIFGRSCENTVQVNVNTIEGKLKFSSVWCTIKDVHASPALKYNWNDSETNKILLSTLYIDRKNILFAPKWNSEVPRFASNLGFVPLVPQKTIAVSTAAAAEENRIIDEIPPMKAEKEVEEQIYAVQTSAPKNIASSSAAAVPDARFDWSDSGLTNPLDSRKFENRLDRGGYSTTSGNDYENANSVQLPAIGTTTTKQINDDVAQILNSLPDLVVMEKQYIVFPIR